MATPILYLPLDGDLTYEDASTGGTASSSGPLRWADGYGGAQAALVEPADTNYVSNPSIAGNTNGWSVIAASATITSTTDEAYSGPTSMQVIPTGATSGEGVGQAGTLNGYGPAAQGQTWTATAYVKGSGSVRLSLVERVGTVAGTQHLGTPVTLTSSWQRIQVTATMADASTDGVGMRVMTAAAGAGTFYMDAAQLRPGSEPTTYIDGNQGTGYAWTGSSGQSRSTRAATTISVPVASPASVAFRYRSYWSSSWQFGYLETLGGFGDGMGSITHDGDDLVIAADRSLVIGPLLAYSDTLSTNQRSILQAASEWSMDSLAPLTGRFIVLGVAGTNPDAPVIPLS